jgi:hypothetical protein
MTEEELKEFEEEAELKRPSEREQLLWLVGELRRLRMINAELCDCMEEEESITRLELVSKARAEERERIVKAVSRWKSLCVECGPNMGLDEDGLCVFCGATVIGKWLSFAPDTIRALKD